LVDHALGDEGAVHEQRYVENDRGEETDDLLLEAFRIDRLQAPHPHVGACRASLDGGRVQSGGAQLGAQRLLSDQGGQHVQQVWVGLVLDQDLGGGGGTADQGVQVPIPH